MTDVVKIFVGKPALDFTAKAILPDNKIDENFNLKTYLQGKKGVLFFYPLNFTFVCPSEIISFNNKLGWFHENNTKVISVSVDSHYCHLAWKNTSYNKGGIEDIQFPMVSDLSKSISKSYNVLNDDGIALRGTFLIDENFILRHMVVNDLQLGRGMDELSRTIEALDHVTKSGSVCPVGWRKGEESITPSKQGIEDYLSSHAEKL